LATSGESLKIWNRIKEAARSEESLGIAVGRVVEGYRSQPWERAVFFAMRQGVIDEWKPRGGLELMLIDMFVSACYMHRFWLRRHVERATAEAESQKRDLEERGKWREPQRWGAESIADAEEMADRFHPMAMRTLRALRDLRRLSPSVSVQGVGQVNIGDKQVNLSPNR
jgi:hypothetical protein